MSSVNPIQTTNLNLPNNSVTQAANNSLALDAFDNIWNQVLSEKKTEQQDKAQAKAEAAQQQKALEKKLALLNGLVDQARLEADSASAAEKATKDANYAYYQGKLAQAQFPDGYSEIP